MTPKTIDRRSKDAPSLEGWGAHIAQLREERGLRLDEVGVYARAKLRWGTVSREYVRRMEVGEISEDRADPVVLLAIAAVFDVPLRDISPLAAQRLEGVQALSGQYLSPTTEGSGTGVRAGRSEIAPQSLTSSTQPRGGSSPFRTVREKFLTTLDRVDTLVAPPQVTFVTPGAGTPPSGWRA